jgi:hypothetical protein
MISRDNGVFIEEPPERLRYSADNVRLVSRIAEIVGFKGSAFSRPLCQDDLENVFDSIHVNHEFGRNVLDGSDFHDDKQSEEIQYHLGWERLMIWTIMNQFVRNKIAQQIILTNNDFAATANPDRRIFFVAAGPHDLDLHSTFLSFA